MQLTVFKYNSELCEQTNCDSADCNIYNIEKEFNYWFDFDWKPDSEVFETFVKSILPTFEFKSEKLFFTELNRFNEHKDWVSITLKMMEYNSKQNRIDHESITLILMKNVVISIQSDVDGDHFESVRERLNTQNSNVSQRNSEYLFTRLIETIEDNYHKIINDINEDLLEIEGFIPEASNVSELRSLFKIKRELLFLRKNISPLRDSLFQMMNSEEYRFSKMNLKQLKTIYERLLYVVDNIDLDREMLSGMLDFHISSNGYKMNNIMKVLTTISTIFMPLGFLVGYYGMNFPNLPLIDSEYGYLAISLVILGVGVTMFLIFKRRRWI